MSYSSLYVPRVPALPSTESIPPELQYWAKQHTAAINALPAFSQFSWPTPESHVTAMPATLGLNLAPASAGSQLWIKRTGSGFTGWVALA